MIKVRILIILRWISQGLNTLNAALFWESEDFNLIPRPEDVTFSAYTGYKAGVEQKDAWKRWQRVINLLFFFDPDHCWKAYLEERNSFYE